MEINKEVIKRLEKALEDMPEGGVRVRPVEVQERDLRLVIRYLKDIK